MNTLKDHVVYVFVLIELKIRVYKINNKKLRRKKSKL
jgi:hypothetical protein